MYPEGADARGRSYEDLRWSHFKNFTPAEMYEVVDQHVFPFLRTLGGRIADEVINPYADEVMRVSEAASLSASTSPQK